jgi:uncharacterized Tic20 family protein
MNEQPSTSPYQAQPQAISATEERNVAMISHLIPIGAMVLSAGLLGFVGSLVVHLIYKDRGPFVRHNTVNSLNIQITMGIVILVSFPLMLVLIGFLIYPAAFVVAVILHIVGAVKANAGQWWTPPFTPRFVKG